VSSDNEHTARDFFAGMGWKNTDDEGELCRLLDEAEARGRKPWDSFRRLWWEFLPDDTDPKHMRDFLAILGEHIGEWEHRNDRAGDVPPGVCGARFSTPISSEGTCVIRNCTRRLNHPGFCGIEPSADTGKAVPREAAPTAERCEFCASGRHCHGNMWDEGCRCMECQPSAPVIP
jgi:hypothetical protein